MAYPLQNRTYLSCTLVVLMATSLAYSQQPSPEDRALAESLFREGRRLLVDERYADACKKFEESYRLESVSGTLLNMADCHEKEGRVATAWAEYNQLLAMARRDRRVDRETIAKEHLATLEPKIPKLVIVVSPEVELPGLKISRNGTLIGPAAWGSEIPVDPGEVVVAAEAPGRKMWRTSLTIEAKGRGRVGIPRLEPATVAAARRSQTDSAVKHATEADTNSQSGASHRESAWIAGCVGLVALGVGTIYGIRAIGKKSDSDERCPMVNGHEHCSAEAVTLNNEARTSAQVSDVALGLGLVSLGVSAYLFLTARSSNTTEQPTAQRRAPAPEPTKLGFVATPQAFGASWTTRW